MRTHAVDYRLPITRRGFLQAIGPAFAGRLRPLAEGFTSIGDDLVWLLRWCGVVPCYAPINARRGSAFALAVGSAVRFHGPRAAPAIDRAALVLSTVGCEWHDDEAPSDWRIPVRRV